MEGIGDRFGVAVAAYETWLERQPFAASTKREYRRWVRAFMAWAVAAPEREEFDFRQVGEQDEASGKPRREGEPRRDD